MGEAGDLAEIIKNSSHKHACIPRRHVLKQRRAGLTASVAGGCHLEKL